MTHRLNRRAFIGCAAASVVAAAVAKDAPASDAPLKIRKAIKYSMLTETNLSHLERFKLLAKIGFEGVELDPGKYDPDEMIAAQRESGLKIHGLVAGKLWKVRLTDPDKSVRADALKYLTDAIREAKQYNASTVLVVPGVVDEKNPYRDVYQRSQEMLAKVIPLAKELDIVLAIENVWNNFLLSPLEAARFVDELKSTHVRWYFDVGNVVRSGWPEHWIEILDKRIIKLDIKEYDRTIQRNEGLYKGFTAKIGDAKSGVDWPTVVSALKKISFQGWATAEVQGGDRERISDIKQRMDRVLG